MTRRREPSVARMGWQDWYREFRLQASQAGIPPEEYTGTTGQGDWFVAALFRDGNTPQEAIVFVKDRQERRARGRSTTVRSSVRQSERGATPTYRRSHPDVEYAVDDVSGDEHVFKTFDEAASYALTMAASTGESHLDVLIWSEKGAEWYGGDDALDQYNEDPEASVFERFEIKVNSVGRVS